MADKKDEARFTLQFSRTDPKHLQVIEILNRQGRRSKAPYIVSAILHYENCPEIVDTAHTPSMDIKFIESVFNRLMKEHSIESAAPDKPTKKPFREPEELQFDDVLEALGQSGIDAFTNAIDEFRKNE